MKMKGNSCGNLQEFFALKAHLSWKSAGIDLRDKNVVTVTQWIFKKINGEEC